MAAFKVGGSAKTFLYCNTTGTLRKKDSETYFFLNALSFANMVMLHNIMNRIKSNVLYYNKYYNQQYSLFFTVDVTAHISGIDPIKFRSWDFFYFMPNYTI